jgi:hypothetical protein
MIYQGRKEKIDQFISYLNEYYLNCSKPDFYYSGYIDSFTEEDIVYFNEKFDLEKLVGVPKNEIMITLFSDLNKVNFGKYLLHRKCFNIDVNYADSSNKSLFQFIVDYANMGVEYFHWTLLTALYCRGYVNTQFDEKFLVEFYKSKIKSERSLEIWCFARACFKLADGDKISKMYSKEKVLLSIISFKMGKPVGFNYPNLLGVANNAIQHYREQGDLMILAMKKYNIYNDLLKRDKKGTFKLKLEDYNRFKPIQDLEFNEIIYQVFPELNEGVPNS